jgi:glycosyltransferase involved in cell wall biosynthesis
MLIFVNARFVTQELSGVQRYAAEISKELKKQYPEAIFLSPKNIVNTELSDLLNVKIIGLNSGHIWEQLDLFLYLKKFKNQNPFLINLANTAPLLFSKNLLVIHDLAPFKSENWNSSLFKLWYRFLLPRLARRLKRLFTVSETMKKEIVKILNITESKIDITYNGLSEIFLEQASLGSVKQKIILAVGSINKRKNYEQLIRSFIKFANPDYRLIIAGKHSKIYTNDIIIQDLVSANKNIELITTADEQALMTLYADSEIFVSVSTYEGFCIPILEALHFNCKVICSDLEVFHEIYGSNVIYVDHTNVNAIADSFKKCINDSEINKNEISKLEQKYSYKKGARKILDFFNKN